ncbi:unnamed protein product [Linum trigynum]|uniref:VQ domain-containing protein n=1 Tax=Linum trigynum TaxID=586398 RepID=A0AAV2EWT0_9ROSI
MDSSGNSSLQSSASGGDEEEYDSRPRPPPPPPPSSSLQLEHQQQQQHHQQQQASLNFLNPFSSNQQNPNPLLFSHHQTSLFDPSQNFFHPFPNHHHHHQQQHQQQQHQSSPSPPENPSFLNLDMVPSSSHHHQHHHQFLRSDHTMLAQQPSSPSASSLPHATTGLRNANPPPPAAATNNNNDHQSSTSTTTTTTTHGSTRNPKKRTRASRRAPTTVLTTDTSNFRAMVQEFTGIPAPPFSAASPYSRLDLFGSSSSSSALRSGFDSMIYPLRPAPHKLHNHLPSSSSFASSHPSHTTNNTDLPSAVAAAGNFQLGPSAQNMMMNQMLSLQSLLHSNDLHHSLKPQSSMIGNDHQIGTTTTMGSGDWGDRVAQPAAIDDVRNPDREIGNNNNNVGMGTYDGSNNQQKASFTATGSGPAAAATEFILHHQNV